MGTDIYIIRQIVFERSVVLWGGSDHTWRGLISWFHSIWKTEALV